MIEQLGSFEIFPGAGFESSILTIILIGVIVRWLCTEWFGFTFAGLVVPGYLASVMIIAPFSGGVIVAESILTYLIVWLLVDYFGDTMVWSASFGRDRFFAFVLVSLFVRLTGELWLWPQLWELAAQSFELSSRPPANLNSLGLVLVPLTANMFWKTGLWRGGVQVVLPTAFVWWVSARLLLPLTNLRFSKFQVHYEAAAIDILASPKTYAIMLVGAAIAARANIRYGWDFGGILIPALVAISFFEPGKVAISVAEAWLLAMLVQGLLRTPLLRGLNLEGPRRIVLVFGVAYLVKYIVAWGVYVYYPHLQVTDFFSFGYLLSSLLALKIMQRGASRVLTPTLLVSASAFIIGGLGADLLFESLRPAEPAITTSVAPSRDRARVDVERILLTHAPLLSPAEQHASTPLSVERLDGIARYISKLSLVNLEEMNPSTVRFEVDALGLHHTRLSEPGGMTSHLISEPVGIYPNQAGVGMLWLRPGASGPAIEVPRGAHDPTRMLAIVRFAQRVQARHVVFGARARLPYGADVEPLGAIPSLFDHVHTDLSTRGDVVRIVPTEAPYSTLWAGAQMSARSVLPGALDALGDVRVTWRHPESFVVPDVTGEAALLELSKYGAHTLVEYTEQEVLPASRAVDSLEQEIERLLFDPEDRVIARDPRTLGKAPSAAELEVLRRGVLSPLLELGELEAGFEQVAPGHVRLLAREMGMSLEGIELPDGSRYWVLSERTVPRRGWGVVMVRQSRGAPLLIETPRPIREESVWRISAALAQDARAQVLTIGSVMRAESGVLTRSPSTSPSLLVATHRAWLASSITEPLVVQVRGLSYLKDASKHPFIVSHERAFLFRHDRGHATRLLDRLERLGVPAVIDVGQPEFASLHGLPDLSAQLASQLDDGRFVRLWVSAPLRQALLPSPPMATWRRMLDLSHPTHIAPDRTLVDWFARMKREAPGPSGKLMSLEDIGALHRRVRERVATRNPLELEELVDELEQEGFALQWLFDEHDGQVWAVSMAQVDGEPMAIALRTSEAPTSMVVWFDGAGQLPRTAWLLAMALVQPTSLDGEVEP